jgi:hypothetical protein
MHWQLIGMTCEAGSLELEYWTSLQVPGSLLFKVLFAASAFIAALVKVHYWNVDPLIVLRSLSNTLRYLT